ncbi:anthranilate synthase component I [Bacillus spongiae]|uniref:Anthranilate synthase component 1 n=1 Tax=Bacillus spongiae TaxID=2683610 RepID=A0ABU8HHT2_9BACI
MTQPTDMIQYDLIELAGDLYTPIQLFQKITGEQKFILESSAKHEESGRYSFIGRNPYGEVKGVGPESEITINNKRVEKTGSLLRTLFETIKKCENISLPFPFIGGGVGYVAYDVIRQTEKIGGVPQDQLGMPDVHFLLYDQLIIFDHLEEKVFLLALDLENSYSLQDLKKRNELLKREVQQNTIPENVQADTKKLSFVSNIEKEKFLENVEIAKNHIRAGDIFQVVLSQRLEADFTGDPFSYYRSLRKENPSPYMYYLDLRDYVVIGTSPESFIKANGEDLVSNPIAGTRKRGKTVTEDKALEMELKTNEKELAEHNMLVDLSRNDLGRVSKIGSVVVSEYQKIERYKHVMHLVSEVISKRKEDVDNVEVIEACLPAGTVSGAPKIRAMQIINELEGTKRGLYSGAVGYISATGDLDLALAIRTMIVKDEKAYVQAGAGVVYDSDPEMEYEETMKKARALLEVKA